VRLGRDRGLTGRSRQIFRLVPNSLSVSNAKAQQLFQLSGLSAGSEENFS
jgi:hypothetical protein